jgi:peptidoglycan/xylan/chitin deacetylase (PgdA/CDA1 family)
MRTRRLVDLLFFRHPDVLYSLETEAPLVGLSIDDGPDAETTPAILASLERHGAHATFFLIGERVDGNEAVVESIVAAGHELGNHGMRDVPAIDLSPQVFEAQLLETHDLLSAFQEPRWYRPGSGWYDESMLEIIARHGYRAALGSSYPLDGQLGSVRLSLAWLRADLEPGEVVVLHDHGMRGLRTAEVLERILPELAERGLRVVSLSELVAHASDPRAETFP